MKDFGEVHYCRGLQVIRNIIKGIIHLGQQTYIKYIYTLERLNIQSCKPSFTPIIVNVRLSRDMCPQTLEEKQIMAKIPYRRIVGCLIYAMLCTWLDIVCGWNRKPIFRGPGCQTLECR
jgi:hypothetical protein